jgi:hypothetical protein
MATKTVKSTAKPKITKTKLYSGADAAEEMADPNDAVDGLAKTVTVMVKHVITTSMIIAIFILPLTL